MAQIDLGGCVSYGWNKVKSNMGFHIVGGLVVMLGGSFSFGLLLGPLMVGYFKAIMKEEQGGKAEVGDVFGAFDKFVPSLIVTLVVFAVSMVPLLGILVGPMLGISLYLVAKGESDGIAALKAAFEHYKANLVMALVTSFVLGIVASLGFMACMVGGLLTAPIALAGTFRLAQQVTGDDGKSNLRAA